MSIDSLDSEDSQLYQGDSNQGQVLRPRAAAFRIGAEFEFHAIARMRLYMLVKGFYVEKQLLTGAVRLEESESTLVEVPFNSPGSHLVFSVYAARRDDFAEGFTLSGRRARLGLGAAGTMSGPNIRHSLRSMPIS